MYKDKYPVIGNMIEIMGDALIAYSTGKVSVPERFRWTLGDPATTFLIMPASSTELGLSIVKTLCMISSNRARGFPAIQGHVAVFDRMSGVLLATLDAAKITALRTAACSGVATDLLAKSDARVLAVFGTGPQARMHIEAICQVRPIERVLLFGRNQIEAKRISMELSETPGLRVEAVSDLGMLRQAEIICTATNATVPLFRLRDVRPDVHINAVGSHTHEMRELSRDILRSGEIIVDSVEFCVVEAGELIDAFGTADEIKAHVVELGAALIDSATIAKAGITIYKSVGNASQDLFAASFLLRQGREELDRAGFSVWLA